MPRGNKEYEQLVVEGINGALSGQGQGVVQRVLQRSNTDYNQYLAQVSLGGFFHSTAEKERRKAIRAVVFLRLAKGEAFHSAKTHGERLNSNSSMRLDLIRDEIRRLVQDLTPTSTTTVVTPTVVTPTVTPTVVVRRVDTTLDLATGKMTAPSELVYENVGDTVTPFSKDHASVVAERLRTLLTGFEAIEVMRGLGKVKTNVELSMIACGKAYKGFDDTITEMIEVKKARVKLVMGLVGAALGVVAGPAGGLVANLLGALGTVAAEAMVGVAKAAAEAAVRGITANGETIGKAIAGKAVEKLTEKACRAQEIQPTDSVDDAKISILSQYQEFQEEVLSTILGAAYEIIGGRDTTFRAGRIGESTLGNLDNRTTPIKKKAMEYLWHVHDTTSFHGSALQRETVAYIQTIQDAMAEELGKKFGLSGIPTFNRSDVDDVARLMEWVLWASYFIPDKSAFATSGKVSGELNDTTKARLVRIGLIGLTERVARSATKRTASAEFYREGRIRIHETSPTDHQKYRLWALFRAVQEHVKPIHAALGIRGETIMGQERAIHGAARVLQDLTIASATDIASLSVLTDYEATVVPHIMGPFLPRTS